MSWEAYRKSKVKRFTLESLSLPEFWIDIRDMKSLTPAEAKELDAKTRVDSPAIDDIISTIAPLVVAWNVTDEAGNPLPVPSKSRESLEKLPLDITLFIAQSSTNEIRKEDELPETKGT
jgi:hypothetical protein